MKLKLLTCSKERLTTFKKYMYFIKSTIQKSLFFYFVFPFNAIDFNCSLIRVINDFWRYMIITLQLNVFKIIQRVFCVFLVFIQLFVLSSGCPTCILHACPIPPQSSEPVIPIHYLNILISATCICWMCLVSLVHVFGIECKNSP